MLDRVLRFKHHLRAEVGGDELVFLIGDQAQYLLRGRSYALVAPLLDGRRSVGEILVALADVAPAPEVYFALRTLEDRGYLTAASTARALGLGSEAAGFWHALGSDPALVAARLAAAPLEVVALGGADAEPIRAAMIEAGLRVVAPDDEPALLVVVVTDYLDPALAAIDQAARASGRRWLPVRPSGLAPWIGPLFGRRDGPCWACLGHRLRWNRPIETWLQRRRPDAIDATDPASLPPLTAPRVALPASARAAASLASLTLAWWLADGGTGAIDDHLLAIELTELRGVRHRVTRRPQCPSCGDATLITRRGEQPVVLTSQRKRFTIDGGFRIMTPAETLARCEPGVLSPITGVLASLGPVPGRDHPSRPVQGAVYRVVPPSTAPGFEDFHKLSSGKGTTPTQARASALCEGLERISAIWHGDEVRRRATRADLGDDAITPPSLQQFSAAQHAGRDQRVTDPKRRVPRAYRDDDELDWTPVWSLSHGRHRWLPTAYCYQHAPHLADLDLVGFNPNGHAAGNCVEEAVLQGFLELVERDAVAIWWYGRLRQPAVALDDHPVAAELRAHYRELGWSVWVLELTTDLGIPTFVALAEREGGGRWSVGFGCHLDARLGVQRALTELNQIFDPDDSAPAPWDPAALGDLSFLRPDPDAAPRTLADHPAITTDDLRADVEACVARAAARGLEVLVLDQSRPDLGLAAVKVIVPGLRHFWPRLGPGRLYDVPVTLGRRATPLAEPDLNPVPLFL